MFEGPILTSEKALAIRKLFKTFLNHVWARQVLQILCIFVLSRDITKILDPTFFTLHSVLTRKNYESLEEVSMTLFKGLQSLKNLDTAFHLIGNVLIAWVRMS